MSKDFYDEDLIATSGGAGGTHAGGPAGTVREAGEHDSFYGRQKRDLPEKVSQATDEIERLRQRQEDLERRKQALVEQRRRIEAYEHGRREMLDKLGRSAVMVVREGEQASRMAALCTETGSLFRKLHQELEGLQPENWPEAEYDKELTQALAQIEAASAEYRRAMDRVNASTWRQGEQERGGGAEGYGGGAGGNGLPQSFTQWIMAGFAFSLPLLIVVVLLALVYILNVNQG
ncbi:MAG: hypothetical protein PHR35_04835 [Kiritimatiellae bacterium]|nr:hypothetical protein [Kiritimatiellia bacterium]